MLPNSHADVYPFIQVPPVFDTACFPAQLTMSVTPGFHICSHANTDVLENGKMIATARATPQHQRVNQIGIRNEVSAARRNLPAEKTADAFFRRHVSAVSYPGATLLGSRAQPPCSMRTA